MRVGGWGFVVNCQNEIILCVPARANACSGKSSCHVTRSATVKVQLRSQTANSFELSRIYDEIIN